MSSLYLHLVVPLLYHKMLIVKAYNGVDVLTIMQTEKDIKRHIYDKVREYNKTKAQNKEPADIDALAKKYNMSVEQTLKN